MKLSVVIVSYNAADYLCKCLDSVSQHLPTDSEIIVFDNASPDRTIESIVKKYPKVKFILHEANVGFSTGNNLAVQQAKGEYILILNPDTIVYANFFPTIFKFIKDKNRLGAVGVRMLDGDGKFLPESKRNIPSVIHSFVKLFGGIMTRGNGYYDTKLSEQENGPTEILTGACMFMKKAVYEEVGGFDEQYFMYGEDIDLSYTLLQHGYQNYYIGEIYITHFKGESTTKDIKYLKRFYGAMEIFISKYYKKQHPLQYQFLKAGLKLRYNIAKFRL